jgi:hypothetical protein
VRSGVRFLTQREKGGVLMPGGKDGKQATLLQQSYSISTQMLGLQSTLDFVNLDITKDTVKTVTGQLSGSAGMGGTDSNKVLTLAAFAEWMANEFTPWAAYHALMAGQLLALDKSPQIWPIRVGKTWRWRSPNAFFSWLGKMPKKPVGLISSVLALNQESKVAFTP